MNVRIFRHAAAALLLTTLSQPTLAVDTTGSLNVSATVSATCSVSTSDVAFGTYNPTLDDTTTGAVNVQCTSGTTYTIALDAGGNAGGATNFNARKMKDAGTNLLPYQLYTESSYTTVWGDGTGGTSLNPTAPGKFTADGNLQSYDVYGKIAAGNYVPSGSYSDIVTVTVSY